MSGSSVEHYDGLQYATVTQTSPLKVRLNGSATAVGALIPNSVSYFAAVGDYVLVDFAHDGRAVVIGPYSAASARVFFNAYQQSPGAVSNGSTAVVNFGSIIVPYAMTLKVEALMSVGVPASSFQAADMRPLIGGSGMSVGGISEVQLPSSSNGPTFQMAAKGTIAVAAGTYVVAIQVVAGGGGSTLTLQAGYIEVEQR